MENLLPGTLHRNQLVELKGQNRIMYFNYIGSLPEIGKKDLLKVLNGKSHAVVDNDLYVQEGVFNYIIKMKYWAVTDEGKKYKPLLEKLRSNK